MTLGDRIVVMKDGVVQQFAEPLDVYAYPANEFVARFIGTPPMNLFSGKLIQDGSQNTFKCDEFSIPLPEKFDQYIGGHIGKEVEFGVRPEDMMLEGQQEADQTISISAKMRLKETLGNELVVHLDNGPHRFISRVDAHSRPELDGELKIYPILERAHIFDKKTGLNITIPESAKVAQ
ncbi:MAG: glycerol-3-phosphate ABC transporter ATP-binding protein, partial [Planctomycetes bacterium]|nr:glycerol-3-phosphate ABC transporter ATP-binding protein [Planctomycetota bacterium]